MIKILVFDSGIGSLSVIAPLIKSINSEIIYFADRKNYPYGKKSKEQLKKIIDNTINKLDQLFSPDYIIIASNTPSLLFSWEDDRIIIITPPLKEASEITKTNNIGLLTSELLSKSKDLDSYINKQQLHPNILIHKINASLLINLVEKGIFINDPVFTKKIIKTELENIIKTKNIDTITLSSTHLPFLSNFLANQFKSIVFLDPAEKIILDLKKKITNKSKKSSLSIYTSGDPNEFKKIIEKLNIKNKVHFLNI